MKKISIWRLAARTVGGKGLMEQMGLRTARDDARSLDAGAEKEKDCRL